jgi:hypothetical protein
LVKSADELAADTLEAGVVNSVIHIQLTSLIVSGFSEQMKFNV